MCETKFLVNFFLFCPTTRWLRLSTKPILRIVFYVNYLLAKVMKLIFTQILQRHSFISGEKCILFSFALTLFLWRNDQKLELFFFISWILFEYNQKLMKRAKKLSTNNWVTGHCGNTTLVVFVTCHFDITMVTPSWTPADTIINK